MKLPPDSVLSVEKDQMLIRDLMKYARAAGIAGHPEYIYQSIKGVKGVTKEDLALSRKLPNLKKEGVAGILYVATDLSVITHKFMALTGLMVRNYIDACYMPVVELSQMLMDGGSPTARILFIPDFSVVQGKNRNDISKIEPMLGWKRELFQGCLVKRQSENLQTVIAVASEEALKKVYGPEIHQFILSNYSVVGGVE